MFCISAAQPSFLQKKLPRQLRTTTGTIMEINQNKLPLRLRPAKRRSNAVLNSDHAEA